MESGGNVGVDGAAAIVCVGVGGMAVIVGGGSSCSG